MMVIKKTNNSLDVLASEIFVPWVEESDAVHKGKAL